MTEHTHVDTTEQTHSSGSDLDEPLVSPEVRFTHGSSFVEMGT